MDPAKAATPPTDDVTAILGHYHLHFAQRPRATRDLELLATLRAALESSVPGVDPSGHAIEARELDETRETWLAEVSRIEREQARLGLVGRAIVAQVDAARFVLARVARVLESIEGDARPSLGALVTEIDEAHSQLAGLDVAGVPDDALALREQLLGQLSEAQRTVSEREAERTGELARLNHDPLARARIHVRTAEYLMARFDGLVVGRPQLVVRPGLIESLAAELATEGEALGQLTGGLFASEEHQQNCQALREQVDAWLAEGRHALQLRRSRTPDELAHVLANEADEILEAAGELPPSDRGRPTPSWRLLCDRMDEVWRQLRGLPLVYGLAAHRTTEAGVADCLAYLAAPWLRVEPKASPATMH